MGASAIALLAQLNNQAGGEAAQPFVLIINFVQIGLAILTIAGLWATFQKAGEPGWAAIIPIYNIIVLLKVAGKPIWWILLLLIPCVNIVILIIVDIEVAKNFGKGSGFGVGLALLGFIFFPILGFGSATYQGPAKLTA